MHVFVCYSCVWAAFMSTLIHRHSVSVCKYVRIYTDVKWLYFFPYIHTYVRMSVYSSVVSNVYILLVIFYSYVFDFIVVLG